MPTPQRPELNALFHKPPEEAIQSLKNKGYKIGWCVRKYAGVIKEG